MLIEAAIMGHDRKTWDNINRLYYISLIISSCDGKHDKKHGESSDPPVLETIGIFTAYSGDHDLISNSTPNYPSWLN